MTSTLRAAPAWVWLVALVVCSAIVRFAFARHMVGPWIMIDEIVYSELAKSFAGSGHFAVREVSTTGYGFVYPIVISPAYALFDSIPTVYSAVKVINSVVVSLAAVPAYLLARRVVSARSALLVAVLTVAVPSTFYAGTVMTESAFYPVFLLLALALVAVLERPRAGSVLLLLGAIGLAYGTRAQAIAALPAALTSPLVVAALGRRPRAVLSYRFLYGTVAALAALAVLAEVARGRSVKSLLGAYAAATNESYGVVPVAHWLLWHLGELDLYVGFVPVFALVVLCFAGTSLAPAERAVVAATVSVVAWFALEVAAFASQPSVQRIEERNLFYVAPLLFTCLAIWIERGLPRPRIPAAAAVGVTLVLAGAVPYERFIGTSATSDTLGVLALWSMALRFDIPAEDVRWVVAGLAAVFLVVALVVRPRAALVLPALVAALYVVAMGPIDRRLQKASIGALFQGITKSDRDWITAAVGSSDPRRVTVLWSGATDRLTVNENEFFNRDVGDVLTLNGPLPGGFAQTPVQLDHATGLYRAAGSPVRARELLVDTSLPIAGRRIAADERKGLVLLRVDGPVRNAYVTGGIFADAWAGRTASYRRFACTGGRLAVELQSDEQLFRRPQVVSAYEGGRLVGRTAVPPARTATLRVPLHPRGSSCTVRFVVARTRIPARVQPGATDHRALGIRFLSFRVSGATP